VLGNERLHQLGLESHVAGVHVLHHLFHLDS
jgi:hypothetical protein